jgi:ABC-type uncharacterized transport system permease subunit
MELIDVTSEPTDADTLATAMPAAWATTGAVAFKPLNPVDVHWAWATDPESSTSTSAPAPMTELLIFVALANIVAQMPACSTLTTLIIAVLGEQLTRHDRWRR